MLSFGPKPDILLDTNVVVDIYTISDLIEALNDCAVAGRDPSTDSKVAYRLERYRAGVALANWLSWKKVQTESLPAESLRILGRRAPPALVADVRTIYTYYWIHYVQDFVLRRWRSVVRKDVDATMKGTACDDLLLKLASEYGVPLITNEGLSPDGEVTPGKLIDRATRQGSAAFTPAQFLAQRGASVMGELACFYKLFCSARNQDRFKRRFKTRRSDNLRLTLLGLERDFALTLGIPRQRRRLCS